MPESKANFDFTDAQVLVTGGSNGIGYATACAFRKAGASVTITGTSDASSSYDADLSGFAYRQLELENNDSVEEVARSLSALDILVNNAGASLPGGGNEWEPDAGEEHPARRCCRRGHRLTDLDLRAPHGARLWCGQDRIDRPDTRNGRDLGRQEDPCQCGRRRDGEHADDFHHAGDPGDERSDPRAHADEALGRT